VVLVAGDGGGALTVTRDGARGVTVTPAPSVLVEHNYWGMH